MNNEIIRKTLNFNNELWEKIHDIYKELVQRKEIKKETEKIRDDLLEIMKQIPKYSIEIIEIWEAEE